MRSNSNVCVTIRLFAVFSASVVFGQSNQEWTAYKQKCGISPGMAYNDWVAAGSKCTSGSAPSGAAGGLTPQQQMAMQSAQAAGYMIGQGLHNILFGQPKPLTAPLDPATQQRALAAEQLNSSGIYLLKKNDYAGAINEFQQALIQSPNDANTSPISGWPGNGRKTLRTLQPQVTPRQPAGYCTRRAPGHRRGRSSQLLEFGQP